MSPLSHHSFFSHSNRKNFVLREWGKKPHRRREFESSKHEIDGGKDVFVWEIVSYMRKDSG